MTPAPPTAGGIGAAHSAGGGPPPGPDDDVTPPAPPPLRKLYRSAEGRMLGGVARGLAGHLALPVSWVRIVFIALTVTNGLGVLLYAAFWFVVPLGTGGVGAGEEKAAGRGGGRRGERRTQGPDGAGTADADGTQAPGRSGKSDPWTRLHVRKPDKGQLFAVAALLVGAAAIADNLQFGQVNTYLWPVLLIGLGVVLVWRQADDARRAHWAEVSRRRGLVPIARSAAGVVLVAAGVSGIVVVQSSASDLGPVLQAALAVLVGVALLAGPYFVRMMQDLSEERLMRIRAQERAEVAAHVHDSVLHTLTLIQRSADEPREVARLARAQERELREWLYKPRGRGEEDKGPQTLSESVKATAAEVEDRHGVPVEVVCVGDCPLDEGLDAQIQAAREAMVNAAKYGGDGGAVQVFAEVEGRTVFVSVRDRGPGFDPDAVPEDRMGVRESIIGRMRRHGGTARLRSAPGEGTEVELEMERAAQS
ncbi:phage shock protein C (PspC) family protein [Streptomyces sp. Amel2xB2]|uniref:ATP-binding protein n=1 Tax=Streptomyces sp. Amel2xB2 TaxID=1305829 RepID=UPI000DB9083C|nr:ATP-binding protein [Streptomyces sp. Amel2xB2]RAJ71798.1 phage shock protein C (PspC) family protein [Streptomyces sp. Amel2xB2]